MFPDMQAINQLFFFSAVRDQVDGLSTFCCAAQMVPVGIRISRTVTGDIVRWDSKAALKNYMVIDLFIAIAICFISVNVVCDKVPNVLLQAGFVHLIM